MQFTTSLFCEVDKYAAASYCAIHNIPAYLNIGDITKADEKDVPDFNTMFGGSPCQDFSVAGKRGGASWKCNACGHTYNPLQVHWTNRNKCPKCEATDIDKTRSSLIVEWMRFLREKKPRFAIYENVKNIVGARFRETFDLFVRELEEYGYNVYWQVLNAKNYGVPQNRERVYCVIIRKDLDNGRFRFPKPLPLKYALCDILDNEMDERYYLSADKVSQMIITPPLSYCIDACYHKGTNVRQYIKKRRRQLVVDDNRVRKLTPKECWRLMGFSDEDIDNAREEMVNNIYGGRDCANTQLYKQAGNSIVVDVLLHIMIELQDAMPYLFEDIKVGSFFSGIGAFEKALERLGENDVLDRDYPGKSLELKQIGYINNYNGDANRVYDGTQLARVLKAEAGGAELRLAGTL